VAKLNYWTYIKWGCLGLSAGSLALSFVWLWLAAPHAPPVQQEATGTGTRVKKPLIVERNDGRMVWRLQAERADQETRGLHLIQPRLELFTESGKVIPIRGRQAWFQPLSKNIRFEGAVVVDYEAWRLQSEVLQYDSAKDELYIPGNFRLRGDSIRARGRTLRAKRSLQRIWVDHGVWIEDSRPAGWSS